MVRRSRKCNQSRVDLQTGVQSESQHGKTNNMNHSGMLPTQKLLFVLAPFLDQNIISQPKSAGAGFRNRNAFMYMGSHREIDIGHSQCLGHKRLRQSKSRGKRCCHSAPGFQDRLRKPQPSTQRLPDDIVVGRSPQHSLSGRREIVHTGEHPRRNRRGFQNKTHLPVGIRQRKKTDKVGRPEI